MKSQKTQRTTQSQSQDHRIMAQNVVGAQLPLVGMDGEEVCPTVLFHLSAVFHFKKVLPTEKKKKKNTT